jgi:hypothetical protein
MKLRENEGKRGSFHKLAIMTELTYEDLNSSLIKVLEPQPNYQSYLFDAFTMLALTSIRPAELFELNRWSEPEEGIFKLNPLKNNNPRYFNEETLTPYFANAVREGLPLYYPFSIRRLRYHFTQFYLYPSAQIGEKEVALYLFRHRGIKKLSRDGLSAQEIAEVMGYTTTTVVSGYINSAIMVP